MGELTKIGEILLWAVIELGDEAYGFRIRQHISTKLGLDNKYGNLYSALGRFDQKGRVFKRTAETLSARRGKARVHYTLSEDCGRAAQSPQSDPKGIFWPILTSNLIAWPTAN